MPRTRSASVNESAAKRAKPDPGIKVGDKIPSVTVKDQSGNEHAMADIKGILVIFAYPKASTGGCTKQANGFNAKFDEFKALDATVFGLSADTERAQTTFKNKLELEFDLLSDPKYELLEPLGAKKNPKGVIRSHWVFKDGVCTLVEHSVKPDPSSVDALEAAKEAAGQAADGTANDAGDDAEQTDEQTTEQSGDQDDKAAEEPVKEEDAKPEDEKAEETKQEVESELNKSEGDDNDQAAAASTINATVSGEAVKQDPELVAKVATKIIAEVVTKATEDGEEIDTENSVINVEGTGESVKLKEAKEDDNAQQAEKNGESAEGTPAKSDTPAETPAETPSAETPTPAASAATTTQD